MSPGHYFCASSFLSPFSKLSPLSNQINTTKPISLHLGLRQAPPPRQLWQPDTSSTRQTRHAGHPNSPQPATANNNIYTVNPASDPKSAHFNIGSYEPKPQMPLTLRPVVTPGNNPELFRQKKLMAKAQLMPKQRLQPQHFPRGLLPGSELFQYPFNALG